MQKRIFFLPMTSHSEDVVIRTVYRKSGETKESSVRMETIERAGETTSGGMFQKRAIW